MSLALNPFAMAENPEASSLAVSINESVEIEYTGILKDRHVLRREYTTITIGSMKYDASTNYGTVQDPATNAYYHKTGDAAGLRPLPIAADTEERLHGARGYWVSIATNEDSTIHGMSALDGGHLSGNNMQLVYLTGHGDLLVTEYALGLSVGFNMLNGRMSIRAGADQTFTSGEFKVHRVFDDGSEEIQATVKYDVDRDSRTGYFCSLEFRLMDNIEVGAYAELRSAQRAGIRLSWVY